MKNNIKNFLFGSLLAISGAYLGIGKQFYNQALNAKKDKKFLVEDPNLKEWQNINLEIIKAEEEKEKEFLNQHPYEVINIQSEDDKNLKLQGYYYNNEESRSKWVIIAHAYSSKAEDMVLYIREFYKQGFQVLALDLRGHGNSEGDYIGMGWHDRLDLLSWIDWILRKDPNAEIVLFGLSMGAATVMLASGENLPSNIKGLIGDCGYSSTVKLFKYQINETYKMLTGPILHAGNTITKLKAGYDLYQVAPMKSLEKNQTPILFIHGDQDTFVPFEMMFDNYRATDAEKDFLIVPGAGHANSRRVAPELYWKTIRSFINKYISDE